MNFFMIKSPYESSNMSKSTVKGLISVAALSSIIGVVSSLGRGGTVMRSVTGKVTSLGRGGIVTLRVE